MSAKQQQLYKQIPLGEDQTFHTTYRMRTSQTAQVQLLFQIQNVNQKELLALNPEKSAELPVR